MKSNASSIQFLLTNKQKPCHEIDGKIVFVDELNLMTLTIFTTVNQTPGSAM